MPSLPPLILRGADLRTVDTHAVRWRGADLRGANLEGLDLSGLDLSGADLRGARLDGTRAHRANLCDADLDAASARDADWSGADLSRSEAPDLVAPGIILTEARVHGAAWRRADLRGARLDGARGGGFRLDRARASGLSAIGASFRRIVLDEADLDGASLRDARLERAALYGVRGALDLQGCDLRGADLRFSDLGRCGLDGADLRGARVAPTDAALEAALLALGWQIPAGTRVFRAGRAQGERLWAALRARPWTQRMPWRRPAPVGPKLPPTDVVILGDAGSAEAQSEPASPSAEAADAAEPSERAASLSAEPRSAELLSTEARSAESRSAESPPSAAAEPASPAPISAPRPEAALAAARATATTATAAASAAARWLRSEGPRPLRRGRDDVLVEDRLGFPEDVARREEALEAQALARYVAARDRVRRFGAPARRAEQRARWALLRAERERAIPSPRLPWRRSAAPKAEISPPAALPSSPPPTTATPAPARAPEPASVRRKRSIDAEARHDFALAAATRERREATRTHLAWIAARRRSIHTLRLAAGLPADPPLELRSLLSGPARARDATLRALTRARSLVAGASAATLGFVLAAARTLSAAFIGLVAFGSRFTAVFARAVARAAATITRWSTGAAGGLGRGLARGLLAGANQLGRGAELSKSWTIEAGRSAAAWGRALPDQVRDFADDAPPDAPRAEEALDFRVTVAGRARAEDLHAFERALSARVRARTSRVQLVEAQLQASRDLARQQAEAIGRLVHARVSVSQQSVGKVRQIQLLEQGTRRREEAAMARATEARLRARTDAWERDHAALAEQDEAAVVSRRSARLDRVRARLAEVPGQAAAVVPRLWSRVRRVVIPRARPDTLGPGLDLTEARLDDAALAGADLSHTVLVRASLVGADLRGADLRGADLSDADLTDARLSGAILDGAVLEGAIFDQALMDGASLEGCRVTRARMVAVRGLTPRARVALERAGADLGSDAAWSRASVWLTAGSIAAGALLYTSLTLDGTDSGDAAALEHAAAEAQRLGKTDEAVEAFEALAGQQDEPEIKVNFLLEAAAAASEAGDHDRALALLDDALTTGRGTPVEVTVRLRLARAQSRASLTTAAASSYRTLLLRIDLSPAQQAEAVVGLHLVLSEDARGEALLTQDTLMAAASTDLTRSALALALADGWAGNGRLDLARAVVESALKRIATSEDTAALRLRLARLLFDSGDADAALLVYRELMDLPGSTGQEARLGGADLLIRQGGDAEAATLLAPLARDPDDTLRSRALIPLAGIAARAGDDTRAVQILRDVLDMADLEPRQMDEARVMLGRLLVRSDPEAAAALVSASPTLKHELLLGQAEALRESGRRKEARALWLEVAEDTTADEETRAAAHMALAELQVEDRDYEGALDRYDTLMGLTSSRPLRQRVQLGYSNTLVRLGKLLEAEARYEALMASSEGDVAFQCKLGLARAAELRGQAEKATRLYVEVGQTEGPWAVEALLSLGQMREKAGDLAGAAEALRLARSARGADAERKTAVDIALARVLSAANDPGAEALYTSLLDATDASVRVAARLAVAPGIIDQDPARAQRYYEEALDEMGADGEQAEARAGWLRATISMGNPAAALTRVQAWLAAETDEAEQGELAVVAVRTLRAEGRFNEAETLASRYREVGGFELGMERAGLMRDLGQPQDALVLLQSLDAPAAEDEAWKLEILADTALEAGDLEVSEAAYRKLAAMTGGQTAAALGRARLLREQGKLQEALVLLEDLDDERALAERAVVLDGLGRYDEAETLYRRMALSTDNEARSAAAVGLGRVLLERDDAAGAITALDAVSTIDDGYRLTAAQVRAEANLALGNLDEARAIYAGLNSDAEARTVGRLGLAELSLTRGDATAAVEQFHTLFTSTEDRFYQAAALAGEVRALAESGDTLAARERLKQLTTDYPERTDAITAAQAALP